MVNCPNCGKSHYSEYYSTRTAMYYPPVWKDGINVNPDGNITTTKYHCLECSHDFLVQYQYGKVIDIKDEGEVKPEPYYADVNMSTVSYTETDTDTDYCTIKVDSRKNEVHYTWEDEIKELKERVAKLERQIAELAGEVYALN